ncbi:radical SAM enzyme, Cfr family [Opitutus terrae PB90-1]|uniref:Probable dual-specificity RNA methyltransferase RlmN 2 n=1 Tax=Opitutus terrae (strain DSM 11246 / JCM 15787 / PB90-1) TaxID=452637 RepID=RLMN2_OPITP|nr:RecName: Full=Probable dual-specificity RNA methyltransferase RlmN 2; AltName: Full=23S rRNA (adenine(2503)-C(2))-methyltransferase 2; AltName: Full=23S rRNA m2A2503 methyltransferase 2; AltName: Full=Ribosomal RNA large subunit methyltransferase N 2; AltName: Full=tRNA (adenine(37)-C(2))-methyltransferase 2; AltName: Full=tRNA m2A37 methyltransferase 2 [Opitutus terrae PB90-1]ACB74122.1 radical SAM enzyme, Cfr family [Opitutus terrae PB90-1]
MRFLTGNVVVRARGADFFVAIDARSAGGADAWLALTNGAPLLRRFTLSPSAPTNLYDFTRAELRLWLSRRELNPVHAARIWSYLYLDLVEGFGAMTELPARVRARLEAEMCVGNLKIARETDSRDGFTRKYLLELADGAAIETVLMRFAGRATACVSSQVGCAMGCVFCATGQMGYTRHLTAGEIVAQAVHVARALRTAAFEKCHVMRDPSPGREAGEKSRDEADRHRAPPTPRLRNLVLMGMGEPLHNYEAVMRAVDILRDDGGLALGAERITLSTVGVVPGILRLAAEKRPVHLAVSLHAADQEERAALVPVAKKWPLDELMAACRTYSETTGRRVFYEWTLIEGRNDTAAHARAVGRLLRGLPAQVNLIPLNPTAGYDGTPGRTEAARRFQEILSREFALPSTVRQRRGIDIAAGCGQLAVAEQS